MTPLISVIISLTLNYFLVVGLLARGYHPLIVLVEAAALGFVIGMTCHAIEVLIGRNKVIRK